MHTFLKSCYLILCLSLCGHTSLTGQSYLPLAVENATWIVSYGIDHYTYFFYDAFKINGDTLFEGQTYKKMYQAKLVDNVSDPFQIVDVHLTALIRDDISTGRVYTVLFDIFPELDGCTSVPVEEMLLYDFSLEAGDTVLDCRTMHMPFMPIESVMSEEIFGENRRVLLMEGGGLLVEGIGLNTGLFSEASGIVHAAHGPALFDYCIGTNFECGLHTATNDVQIGKPIVYPNPVTDELHWKTDVRYESAVIYASTGQVVEQHTCAGSPSIDVSGLPSGLYFLELREANQSMMTRFLKQ